MAIAPKSLEDCINSTEDFFEDEKYKLSKAKAPNKKRQHKSAMEWWQSLNIYLKELKELQTTKK